MPVRKVQRRPRATGRCGGHGAREGLRRARVRAGHVNVTLCDSGAVGMAFVMAVPGIAWVSVVVRCVRLSQTPTRACAQPRVSHEHHGGENEDGQQRAHDAASLASKVWSLSLEQLASRRYGCRCQVRVCEHRMSAREVAKAPEAGLSTF